jgi:hypothetical protein
MNDVFKQQDEFLQKMIEMWKQDERLKPFDVYFRWKTGEISTAEWREQKDARRQMRVERDRLMKKLWDANNPDDYELELVVDAIDDELIRIQQILGF